MSISKSRSARISFKKSASGPEEWSRIVFITEIFDDVDYG
jgi:hypothetical protein